MKEQWEYLVELVKAMKAPLRPHYSEIEIVDKAARSLQASQNISKMQVLLLGVTPEIVNIRWPEGTFLTAVDRSEAMIRAFWVGDKPSHRRLVRADWFDMPFPAESFDLILADGAFNTQPFPDGYRKLAKCLTRLLKNSGQMSVRIFSQQDPKETPEDVLKYFLENDRLEMDMFTYRLATSLQVSPEQGIYVSKDVIEDYLIERGIPLADLYKKTNMTPPDVTPLPKELRDQNKVSYPTEGQFISAISEFFKVLDKSFGTHELAFRTPVFLLGKVATQFL
jgi:hypothetical protein